MQPKQIFETYTKSDIKGFKTDEKGVRVILRKIIVENESDLNAGHSGVSNRENAAAYQTLTNTGRYLSFAENDNNDKSLNTKFDGVDNNGINIASNYEYPNSDQNELLVASGKRDNPYAAVYEEERLKSEIQSLSVQLKQLEKEKAEINRKIKEVNEQPRTSKLI